MSMSANSSKPTPRNPGPTGFFHASDTPRRQSPALACSSTADSVRNLLLLAPQCLARRGMLLRMKGCPGCLRATPIPPAVPQTCVEYYSFSDLWEIVLGDVGSVGDTTATVKYEYVLVRELSPLLSPMGGGMAVPLYRESHRMFVIGGANKSIASMILSGSTREATGEVSATPCVLLEWASRTRGRHLTCGCGTVVHGAGASSAGQDRGRAAGLRGPFDHWSFCCRERVTGAPLPSCLSCFAGNFAVPTCSSILTRRCACPGHSVRRIRVQRHHGIAHTRMEINRDVSHCNCVTWASCSSVL